MLTQEGLYQSMTLTGKMFNYFTEPSKINFKRIHHDLYVQMAVISRLKIGDYYLSERMIQLNNRAKIPDAIIVSDHKKSAIEVELLPKTNARIYRWFASHLKALHSGIYNRVEYIFKTKSLMLYYLKRFKAEYWPVYNWDSENKRWYLRRNDEKKQLRYFTKNDCDILKKFKFTTEPMYKDSCF